jgi:hypothetical protein
VKEEEMAISTQRNLSNSGTGRCPENHSHRTIAECIHPAYEDIIETNTTGSLKPCAATTKKKVNTDECGLKHLQKALVRAIDFA